ncbi:MAG: two-component system sensor protein, partial [Deltaproteobacteria bacterium]|nr:two-component system sensor protein [Deltaproteobacteria bacterium]MBW2536036.1 two-component system sensor protein [Deltaproteobacteria bacterium]
MDLLYYDQRTRTTLVCGALALTIALSLLLRGKVRKVHLLFAAFATDVGLWYLSQSLFGFFQASVWERLQVVLPVLMPVFAVNLFEAMVPYEEKTPRIRLGHVTVVLAVPMVALVLSPYLRLFPVRVGTYGYVFAVIFFGLYQLYQRGRRSRSRATKRRVGLLVVAGALAALFIVADFVWVIGYVPAYSPPPIGVVISVVFLFMLGQALRHERLLDLYEMLGQLLVATAVGFLIGLIFYLLVSVMGQFATMYLNAVLAAIVVLVLYNPLRERVEQQIRRLVFGERRNLEKAVTEARRELAHVLEVERVGPVVLRALEQSRRVTGAAIYLQLEDGSGFERLVTMAAEAPKRIELAAARALLEKLDAGTVVIEQEERLLRERRDQPPGARGAESVVAAAEVLGPLRSGV